MDVQEYLDYVQKIAREGAVAAGLSDPDTFAAELALERLVHLLDQDADKATIRFDIAEAIEYYEPMAE